MHFEPRVQTALREVGLSTDDIERASALVVEATRETADRLEAFFADEPTVVSDMDRAHSDEEYAEHELEYVDLYTHAADIRGYVRFDSWGVPVEGGRVLEDDVLVELSLGPTINDRVRFARDRDRL